MSFHKKIGGVNSVSVLENKAVLLLYVLYIAVFLIGVSNIQVKQHRNFVFFNGC